jgi:hypothetical protein
MRSGKLLLLAALPFCARAGYMSAATVTFSPASSTTATGITLAFSGSDAKLKTTLNGGQIQNTVMRDGVVAPADFALTTDSTCATIAGYNWGIDYYDGANGIIQGWVLISSLTTSASVTPTVCIGNGAVTSYQGGGQGAEFDSYTQADWHFPNGTTLSALDSSANANNGNINSGVTAVNGRIDGAAYFNGASQGINVANNAGLQLHSGTISAWINETKVNGTIVSKIDNSTYVGYEFAVDQGANTGTHNGQLSLYNGSGWASGTAVVDDGAWHYVTVTFDGTNTRFYTDGTLTNTVSQGFPSTGNQDVYIGTRSAATTSDLTFSGSMDEVKLASTVRSAGWIATEYANQSNPPAIGSFRRITIYDRLIIF